MQETDNSTEEEEILLKLSLLVTLSLVKNVLLI